MKNKVVYIITHQIILYSEHGAVSKITWNQKCISSYKTCGIVTP